MNAYVAFWSVWIAGFLVVETLAVLRRGTTLSSVVWQLLHTPIGRPLMDALGLWLAWHWYVEGYYPSMRRQWRDDAAIASIGAVLSAVLAGRRR